MKKLIVSICACFACCFIFVNSVLALEDVFNRMGKVYDLTRTVPTTDADQVFTTAYDAVRGSTSDWAKVKAVYIQCKTKNALFAWGVATNEVTPTTAFTLAVGESLYLTEESSIQTLHIGSEAAGNAAALVVQLFY